MDPHVRLHDWRGVVVDGPGSMTLPIALRDLDRQRRDRRARAARWRAAASAVWWPLFLMLLAGAEVALLNGVSP